MPDVKKTRTVTKSATLTFPAAEIEAAIIAAIKRDNRELRDYSFTVEWADGGIVATGTLTTGGEEADG